MAYEIIDWIFETGARRYGLDLDKPRKRADFSSDVQKIADGEKAKGNTRLEKYMGRMYEDTSPQGRNILRIISANNTEWVDNMTSRIDTAETDIDLGVVKDRLSRERGFFEEDSGNAVEKELKEKAKEIEGITEDMKREIDRIKTGIGGANTQEELGEIDLNEIRRLYGSKVKGDIKSLVDSKSAELVAEEEEVFERLFDRIGEASTIPQLDSLSEEVGRATLTIRSESELKSLIEESRGLITEE